MWPFRRSSRASRTPQQVYRAGPGAWRGLDPMPTVQTQSLATFDPQFQHQLATWGDPSFLAPLGHHVVPGAPSGTVGGLARPAQRTFAPAPWPHEPRMSYVDTGADVDDWVESEPERPLVSTPDAETTPPPPSVPAVRPVVQPTRVESPRPLTRSTPPAMEPMRIPVQRTASHPSRSRSRRLPRPRRRPHPRPPTRPSTPRLRGRRRSRHPRRRSTTRRRRRRRRRRTAAVARRRSPAPCGRASGRRSTPLHPSIATAIPSRLPRLRPPLRPPRCVAPTSPPRSRSGPPWSASANSWPERPHSWSSPPRVGQGDRPLVGEETVSGPTVSRSVEVEEAVAAAASPAAPGAHDRPVASDATVDPTADPISGHEVGTLGTSEESSPIGRGLQVHVHQAEEAEDADDGPVATVPVPKPGPVEAPSSVMSPTVQPLVAQRTPLRPVVTASRQATTPDSPPTFAPLSVRKNVPEPSVEGPPRGVGLLGERPVQRVRSLSTPAAPTSERNVTTPPDEPVQRTFANPLPSTSRTTPGVAVMPNRHVHRHRPTSTFRASEADDVQTITFASSSFEPDSSHGAARHTTSRPRRPTPRRRPPRAPSRHRSDRPRPPPRVRVNRPTPTCSRCCKPSTPHSAAASAETCCSTANASATAPTSASRRHR